MIKVKGYSVQQAGLPLMPREFERNEPHDSEVLIDILYCGICHADIHQARNEYGGTVFPLVPGHEIVGRVVKLGDKVHKFKVGDLVAVGYFIDSCGHCSSCRGKEENYCENGITPTQNGKLSDGTTTKGGYSQNIVVKEEYVLKVSEKLNAAAVAPLLCAGITAYSPLKYLNISKGHKVAILGLGGLGHMAVKFSASFNAEVTVVSGSPAKKDYALQIGASDFILTSDPDRTKQAFSSFDFVIDTVSAKHDYNSYLNLLKKDGTMVLLGVPPETPELPAFMLISKRRKIMGSLTGSINDTQEMLDYCAEKNITADVEIIAPEYINQAFARVLKGDIQSRFVIDMKKL